MVLEAVIDTGLEEVRSRQQQAAHSILKVKLRIYRDFLGGPVVKTLHFSGEVGSSPGPGRCHMPRSN